MNYTTNYFSNVHFIFVSVEIMRISIQYFDFCDDCNVVTCKSLVVDRLDIDLGLSWLLRGLISRHSSPSFMSELTSCPRAGHSDLSPYTSPHQELLFGQLLNVSYCTFQSISTTYYFDDFGTIRKRFKSFFQWRKNHPYFIIFINISSNNVIFNNFLYIGC